MRKIHTDLQTTLDCLRAARDLVQKGWCQGALARNQLGEAVQEFSDEAIEVCTMGAILRAGRGNPHAIAAGWNVVGRVVGPKMGEWNDREHRTQAQVIGLFDRAIELAQT